MRYRHHDFAPHNKLLQKNLSQQTVMRLRSQKLVSDQCARRAQRSASTVSVSTGRLSQRSLGTNERRLCAKSIQEKVRVVEVIHSAAAGAAVLCLCCHGAARERGSSSLHAHGGNKCCFHSQTNLSERRKAREQVDLKEQRPVRSSACVRACVCLCVCVCANSTFAGTPYEGQLLSAQFGSFGCSRIWCVRFALEPDRC